jgi:hypothetical protein
VCWQLGNSRESVQSLLTRLLPLYDKAPIWEDSDDGNVAGVAPYRPARHGMTRPSVGWLLSLCLRPEAEGMAPARMACTSVTARSSAGKVKA